MTQVLGKTKELQFPGGLAARADGWRGEIAKRLPHGTAALGICEKKCPVRSFSTCWLSMELTLSLDTVVVRVLRGCGICGVVE